MMPKGVEHFSKVHDERLSLVVRIPMMPKGVEHVMAKKASKKASQSENSHDAERR